MKQRFLTAILAAAIAVTTQMASAQDGQAKKKQASQAHVLTNAEFDALLAKPDQLLILDVRRPDEIISIGGFPVYLSIQNSQLAKSLDWIPKDRTIVTVSNHAARGGGAADLLSKAGFKVAGTIGAETYEKEGGKLTKIAPPKAPATTAENK